MDDRTLVLQLVRWIETHLDADLDTQALVEHSGYSLNRLRQKFYGVTGETPSGYLRKRKLTEAAKEVVDGACIAQVALKYGYSSQDNFTTAFHSWFGVTPKEIFHMDRKYKRFMGQMREVFNIMELTDLTQAPFCSSFMGAVKGAADWFDLDWPDPMLFGLSGHINLTNIHKELCPSGPYAWNKEGLYACLARMGIEIWRETWFDKDSTLEARIALEAELRSTLEAGGLAMLEGLEYQLVCGWDEQSLHFLKPWGMAETELPSLSLGSWSECLDRQGFAGFKFIRKGKAPLDFTACLKASLAWGQQIYHGRGSVGCNASYQQGLGAWDNWQTAVQAGHGSSHGHWWNAMVWAENRHLASRFYADAVELLEGTASKELCRDMSGWQEGIAACLDQVQDKAMAPQAQGRLLAECRELDAKVMAGIDRLTELVA